MVTRDALLKASTKQPDEAAGTRFFVQELHGRILLVLGDARSVLEYIPNYSVALIVTDPPYGVQYKTGHRKVYNTETINRGLKDDDVRARQLMHGTLWRCSDLLTSEGAMYVFCNIEENMILNEILKGCMPYSGTTLFWIKNNWSAGNLKDYAKRVECIAWARKGKHILRGGRDHNVLYFNRVGGKDMIHPTEKPVPLLEYLLAKSSSRDDLVLDPFSGSGSLAQAALLTGRYAIAIEQDRAFWNASLMRLCQSAIPVDPTTLQPELVLSSPSFSS